MDKRVEHIGFWLGGTLVSLCGVYLVRVLSPTVAGVPAKWIALAGYFLALTGISLIISGIRKKHKKEVMAKPAIK
ncbi:MAG TPA: hypothetical protein PLT64_04630 [Syntrophales bacterium]|nr:hypothetical protein [Syntrophales bacterium]HOL59138.1 hypothetical protein [Syntrophales bacterium]HPO36083.1 hypothetical protein [Syntrophales bacterium]